MEKGGVKRFASQSEKERTTDSVPFFNEVQMKGKTEKNIEELSIGLKNDYICSELGEQSRLGKEGIAGPCL